MIKIARNLKSPAILKRRKKILRVKIILACIGLGLFLFLLSWVSKAEKFEIQTFDIKGNFVTRSEDISKIISSHIANNYFHLFSKKNIFLYPKSKIKKDILDSFLCVKDARISFADFQTIHINIIERKPFALYCQHLEALPPNAEEECYFMDESAFIYARTLNFSENIYFRFGDDCVSSAKNILGTTYLAEARKGQFEKVNLFVRYLKDINIEGVKLVVRENGNYELFFGDDSKLIFDADQDFDEIFENLRATLINLGDLENKKFEYIDLRFNNKVLYKFKE